MNEVREARAFASGAHAAAGQRYGDRPYYVHLAEVVDTLLSYGYRRDRVVMAAAWLHDVVEDTQVTVDDICEMFCEDVARLVDAVSDRPGADRASRKAETYSRLAQTPHAIPVKLADRMANVRACIRGDQHRLRRMYCEEDRAFQDALRGVSADRRVGRMWRDYHDLILTAKRLG